MRTGLDHLPAHKQRELERVVQLVFEEFEDSFALARREWKKQGRILKVVLYGSYARGGCPRPRLGGSTRSAKLSTP
jgi:hypothetical protein